MQDPPQEAAEVLGHRRPVDGEVGALDGLECDARRRGASREGLEEDGADGVEVSRGRRFSRREDLRSDVRSEGLTGARVAQSWQQARSEAVAENLRLPFVGNAHEGRHEESMRRSREAFHRRPGFERREQPLRDEEAVLDGQRRAEEAHGEEVVERAPLDVRDAHERRVVDGAHHGPPRDGRALDVVHEMDRRFHRGEKRRPIDRNGREGAHEEERS